MQCLQVADNGDVSIQWIPTVDTFNNFVQYNIYSAVSFFGPYTLVGNVANINATNFVDTTPGALIDNVYYYVAAENNDGTNTFLSIGSDTTATMHLNATPSTIPQGYANLDWTSPFQSGYVPPVGTEYLVWREYPAGTWTSVQNLPFGLTIWDYEISFCNEFLNFRIECVIPGGCNYISNISGDNFQDQIPPAIPVVSSISVNHTTNDGIVNWEVNPSGDTQAYIVYECENPGFDILDTVYGINNTQYTDFLANPSVGPLCYLVAAFDTCYSGVPPSPNTSPTTTDCHCSVHLPSISYQVCEDNMSFYWTPYLGWPDGVEMYIIHHAFAQNLPAPFYLPIDTVAGNVLNYIHTNIQFYGYNSYYIEAVAAFTNYRANSNIQSVLTNYPIAPDYVYLASASVVDHNQIEVVLEIDPVIDEHLFTLQRFDPNGGNWDDILTESVVNSASLSIPDADVETEVFTYTYRVITENFCEDIIDTTNIGISILQEGFASTSQVKNILTWTAYSDWEDGVEMYKVHRTIGDTGPDQVIAELSPQVRTYEDDVAVLLYTDGNFCYTIEAVEVPSTSLGISHSAFSNELCLSQEPKIWIPNAFIIDGFNNTFNPVISFADFENYKMIIFSRWGDVIYETSDINSPWDGTLNGKLVQEGEYAYFVSVKDGKGRAFEQAGHVIMISKREK